MIVDVVRTWLEMTDPADLCPASDLPAVELEPVDNQSTLLREVVRQVGSPHHWSSASLTAEQWRTAMADPLLRCWFITVDGECAGLAEIRTQPGGSVEIVSFGLLPDRVGDGYGGAALTQVVRLARTLSPADDVAIRRVWLRTDSLDHPNALRNCQRRGGAAAAGVDGAAVGAEGPPTPAVPASGAPSSSPTSNTNSPDRCSRSELTGRWSGPA